MYMTVVQSNPTDNPEIYAFWRIEEGTEWKAFHPIFSDNTGSIKVLFRLCGRADFDRHHKMDINITNLTLDNGNFGMDQNDPNAIDYKTCEKGMTGIWTSAPNVKISGIVLLGFVCTDKILTPDARVIDFNEEISLRASKDVILVGDVL